MTDQARPSELSARLELVREWADSHPYTGMHDAPPRVECALGYTGSGARKLRKRLNDSAKRRQEADQ